MNEESKTRRAAKSPGSNINKARFTDERVSKIKRYLQNPKAGDPDNVKRQLLYYKNHHFTIQNGRVFVKMPSGDTKELLSDSQAIAKVKSFYGKSDESVGRIPTIYHTLKKKYVNISWNKVDKVIKADPSY